MTPDADVFSRAEALAAAEAIRECSLRPRVFVAATGAGAGLQALLWSPPGMSAAFAGAAFPYGAEQGDDFLGYRPDSYCSMDAAVGYAMSAYVRARESVIAEGPDGAGRTPVGLGLTASVASEREHRGDHRVFVCAITPHGATVTHLGLPKAVGTAARRIDGFVCDMVGLDVLMEALGLPLVRIAPGWTRGQCEQVTSRVSWSGESFVPRPSELRPDDLRRHLFSRPVFSRSGLRQRVEDLDVANLAFLPASLDPPHEGHRRMADVVERERRRRVVYTVTADSAHKPPLSVPQMLDRVAAVRRQRWEPDGARTVVFTQGDPLFIDKARRWPGTEFVVGADALFRMLDPSWGHDPEALLHALQGLGVRFLVFGREVEGHGFVMPHDAHARAVNAVCEKRPGKSWIDASRFNSMFVAMPGRWDVSSTKLREQAAAPSAPGVGP